MISKTHSLADIVGLVLLAAAVGLVGWRMWSRTDATPVPVGTSLPPLNMAGWLNLAEGETFDPTGEIVVVDCWATWCGPCRADLPRMALIAADYRPLGVKFVGVTQETADDLPLIKELVEQTPGFDWPVGYGGTEFMAALNIHSIPTVILFGRDGKALWSGFGTYGLEAALGKALAADDDAVSDRKMADDDPVSDVSVKGVPVRR